MRTIITLFASLALAHAGELHQAARLCDMTRMAQLLLRHPPLNGADENGMTPLHIAIDSRQTACVRLLLDAGADRKARDRQGRTALDAATKIVDIDDRAAILLLVLNAGQEIPRGSMPWSLEYSVRHRQTNLTKMLLDFGADPNAIFSLTYCLHQSFR